MIQGRSSSSLFLAYHRKVRERVKQISSNQRSDSQFKTMTTISSPDQCVLFVPDSNSSIHAAGGKQLHLGAGGQASDHVHVVIIWSVVMAIWHSTANNHLLPPMTMSMWSLSCLLSWRSDTIHQAIINFYLLPCQSGHHMVWDLTQRPKQSLIFTYVHVVIIWSVVVVKWQSYTAKQNTHKI